MDEHALQVLEYPKVKELLRQFTATSLGREAVGEMRPMTYIETIRGALAETEEMTLLYAAGQAPPLDGIHDISDPLRRSQVIGAILEPAEFYLIGETVRAAASVRNALRKSEEANRARRVADRLVLHPEIAEALDRVFDRHQEIRDGASHHLARIRKTLRQHRDALVTRLERLMRGKFSEYLSESYHTQREGRYVLPVDARYQKKVTGIIHDRSASGATVFIEPIEIIDDGNRLKDLQREEQNEMRRILRELTEMVAAQADALLANLEIFRWLDFVSAKARFALKYDMRSPKLNSEGRLVIREGRHPLLLVQCGRDSVVPLDLEMTKGTRGLVLTGPNTGGKTVVLKTVGLLTLMMQSGMLIPVAQETDLPIFQDVCADIGDEQSLEQSLSTFSSHMGQIRRILENARVGALSLLDELGSGTDPREGGALACGIIQELLVRGSTFVVTTHLQDVKVFAHQAEGVVNGAMEFDLRNLNPTFRFHMGLPGQSNAIQIASRLGLPAKVIERAQTILTERGDSPEEMLARLGEEAQRSQETKRRAEAELAAALELQKESEERLSNAKREAQNITQRAERKAQYFIQELERRIKDMEKQEREYQRQWQAQLDALLKQSRETAPPESILSHLRQELESAKQKVSTSNARPQTPQYKRSRWTWEQLKPGARIRLAGLTEMGKVTRVWPEKGVVEAQVSAMTLRVKEAQILAVLGAIQTPEEIHPPVVKVERPEETPGSRVDIHGMTVEEMIPVLQQYLDRAYRGDLSTVTIVHGFGTGILRREVRRLLAENPIVRRFKNGEDFEGGGGVTVVEFSNKV